MNWSLLVAPLVGGVIGYITNGIAIRMLFRPLKPVYIWGKQLPFTPGIIPKEKARIAKSIGHIVSKELMNEEILSKALLKDDIYAAIEKKVDDFIKHNEHNEETFEALISRIISKDRLTYLKCETEEVMTERITQRVIEMNLGQMVIEKMVTAFKEGKFGSLGALSLFVNASMIESLGSKLEPVISQMIVEEGEVLIRKAVEAESDALLQEPISEVIVKMKGHSEFIKSLLVRSYQYVVRKKLADALEMINMAKVVEERINAYEPLELEKIILEIMAKELRAIVWLGALLGAVMGCVMNFLPL